MADEEIDWSEDPGWRLDWRLLVPWLNLRYVRAASADPLVGLRSMFIAFVVGFALFGVVIGYATPFAEGASAGYWVLAAAAVALGVLVVEPRLEPPLSCESEPALSVSYRRRFFLRISTAQAPVLIGFVGAFVDRSGWIYYACLVASVPALLRAAPTRSALQREQDELTARGCERSLVAALRRPQQG